ncbi:MAG: hypothetical protein ABIU97_09805 [Dehalococcoidia bacterium]
MTEREGASSPARVRIENVNHPGTGVNVDAAMYGAMRDAMLAVLPSAAPGLTEAQLRTAVRPEVSEDLYPGGAKVGWWAKAVQLDLEAKGEIVREPTKPLRWHRPTEVRRPVQTSRDGGNRPVRHGGNQSP